MKVLVGVSVFAVPDLVKSCLTSLIGTPADVLVIDSKAADDVKDVISRLPVNIIVSPENGYCNGGWNDIMRYGLMHNYDVIGLGSSDVELLPGWYDILERRMSQTSCEVCIPRQKSTKYQDFPEEVEYVQGGVAGYFSFLPRKAVELVYPIPHTIKHWFGDQYMFEKLRANGWKIAILNRMLAYHQQSAITAQNPEAYRVIEEDKKAWQALGGSVVLAENHDSEKSIDNGDNGPRRIVPRRTTAR